VPQEDDVARISIKDGVDSWPTAPIAPLRSELVARNSSWFIDELGRRVLLRGINLQGSSKLPYTPADERATHLPNAMFEDYHNVSFVGRPFPLSEADFHLGRLRCMGFTFLRFLITWEAIEHEGPDIYDQEYLAYLKDMIAKCAEHGISVFVDFHQDVWSRWTGGDGAPAWTLEKVGFDLSKLDASAAAITQHHCNPAEYPKMVWNSNNSRLAAGTMWTLFFAGNDFAPKTMIDGVPVQDYLQSHFLGAMAQVASTLKDSPNVIGFDILNEPSVGFVGFQDVRDIGPNSYFIGWRVDPWSAMQMGAGETCTVKYFSSFMYLDGTRDLNTSNVVAWKNGPSSCAWLENGVWKLNENTGKPQLLKPFYFQKNPKTAAKIDFLNDYGIPFWKKCSETIRQHIPDAVIFVEPILDMTDPSKVEVPVLSDEEVGAGYVWASHYYDGMTLMTKSFSKYMGMDSMTQKPSLGMRWIQNSYSKGISVSKKEASKIGTGGVPVLIGETGVPFDMGGGDRKPMFFSCRQAKTAFETGNFSTCTNALNRSMSAMEEAKVSYTIWCYQPDNTNKYGDGWNGEDLSLFSKDQVVAGDEDNLFAGGRSLQAAIRPYPFKVAGHINHFSFSLYRKDRRFSLKFKADHNLETNETVIFLPKYQYPHGVNVTVKKGGGLYKIDWDSQTLTYTHTDSSTSNHIVVTKVLAPKKKRARRLELPSAGGG